MEDQDVANLARSVFLIHWVETSAVILVYPHAAAVVVTLVSALPTASFVVAPRLELLRAEANVAAQQRYVTAQIVFRLIPRYLIPRYQAQVAVLALAPVAVLGPGQVLAQGA